MKTIAKIFITIIVVIVCLLVILEVRRPGPLSDAVYHDFDSIELPYAANAERVERIKANSHRLKQGMLDKEVSAILGKPDYASRIYSSHLGGKEVGKSYAYILSQDKREGSQRDKNRRWIVVQFDFDNKVTRAFGGQVPFFTKFGLKK